MKRSRDVALISAGELEGLIEAAAPLLHTFFGRK
jgi:hypothetical protein